MRPLLAFFVDRPLIVNLVMVLIVVAGLKTIHTLDIQGAANIDFGIFTVTTVRAGAGSEKMELSITVPLEEELLKVESIKRVMSNSMEGLSIIQLNADTSADNEQLRKIEADIQKAIDRAVVRLPQDIIEQPLLHAVTSADRPIASLMVSGMVSEEVLRAAVRQLQNRIREVDGVVAIDRLGYRDREVRVMLDPQKLARLSVNYDEIETAISRRNVTETGGSIEAIVGEQDVVAIGEFEQPEDVASVIVRAYENGDYLVLRDIADVVMDYDDWQLRYSMDGAPAIRLVVKPASIVNEFKVMADIRQAIADAEATLPPNVRIDIVEDGSEITDTILSSLLNNAAIGGILIAIVLLFFFPWRAMIWVVVGLPIAILISLTSMQLVGIPFSAMVMVAMILMLGLLVDDAIVTSESIYSHFEQGKSPREAAIDGVAAIANPVITGALTTVIAMTPMLLITGIDSKFMWVIPATVVFVVIGSLLECLFLLPSHLAESLNRAASKKAQAGWFTRLENIYRHLLQYHLQRPYMAMAMMSGVFLVAVSIVSQFSNFEPYPDVDTDNVVVIAELPTGTSLEMSYQALNDVEQRIKDSAMGHHINTSYVEAGGHDTGELNYMLEGQQQNWGKVVVRLHSFNGRNTSAQEITDVFRQALQGMEQFTRLEVVALADYPPSGRPVELQVIYDGDGREQVSEEILQFLKAHPLVTQAWSNYSPGRSLIELKLDYQAMARYSVKTADITKALQVAYDGILVEELQTREELIRYRLQLQDRYRRDSNALRSLNVINSEGATIPLRNMADFEIKEGRVSIFHYAGLRAESVFAEIDRDRMSPQQINSELKAFVDQQGFYQQYPNLRLRYGGELENQAETAKNMSSGLLLVIVAIFVIMVILFNSLSLPISALLLIPLSFVIVMVIFVVHGLTLSVSALVGMLGLVGVLVNDALVMIDHIRRLHLVNNDDKTLFSTEVIIEGAVDRLRPLLITSITTLVGLGPAAYGIAGTHPTTEALLLVMFWGVAVGAAVTLFSLPLYLVIDGRIKQKLASIQWNS